MTRQTDKLDTCARVVTNFWLECSNMTDEDRAIWERNVRRTLILGDDGNLKRFGLNSYHLMYMQGRTSTGVPEEMMDRWTFDRWNVDGVMYLHGWQRDCDMSEGTWTHEVYSAREYREYLEDQYDGAEGGMRIGPMTKADYDGFEASHRDRALEAFENGHPYSIHV